MDLRGALCFALSVHLVYSTKGTAVGEPLDQCTEQKQLVLVQRQAVVAARLVSPKASKKEDLPDHRTYVSIGEDAACSGTPNFETYELSIDSCMVACDQKQHCTYITYNAETKSCALHENDLELTMSDTFEGHECYEAVDMLWPRVCSQGCELECVPGDTAKKVEDQHSCQREAIAAGHDYYQFSDEHGMCATMAICDKPKESKEFRVYSRVPRWKKCKWQHKPGQYLQGYTTDVGSKCFSEGEAEEKCEKSPDCQGITKQFDVCSKSKWTLREGPLLIAEGWDGSNIESLLCVTSGSGRKARYGSVVTSGKGGKGGTPPPTQEEEEEEELPEEEDSSPEQEGEGPQGGKGGNSGKGGKGGTPPPTQEEEEEGGTPPPTATNPPTTTPEPDYEGATGDPHMTNILGQRFNVFKVGRLEFLRVPFQSRPVEANLTILATVDDIVGTLDECKQARYITSLVFGGAWVSDNRLLVSMSSSGQMRVSLGGQRLEPSDRPLSLGQVLHLHMPSEDKVELRAGETAFAVTPSGNHGGQHFFLNFNASSLKSLNCKIGGLLGEDDHSTVGTPPAECQLARQKLQQTKLIREEQEDVEEESRKSLGVAKGATVILAHAASYSTMNGNF
jgi:hypothetical protein